MYVEPSLRGRGIARRRVEVPAGSLKPSQADYSPEKVARARGYTGRERRILISSDGHVADGHHQWLSKLHKGAKLALTVKTSHGKAPTGTVTVKDGKKTIKKVKEKTTGVVKVVEKHMKKGKHKITATYSGDSNNKASKGTLKVTVK